MRRQPSRPTWNARWQSMTAADGRLRNSSVLPAQFLRIDADKTAAEAPFRLRKQRSIVKLKLKIPLYFGGALLLSLSAAVGGLVVVGHSLDTFRSEVMQQVDDE